MALGHGLSPTIREALLSVTTRINLDEAYGSAENVCSDSCIHSSGACQRRRRASRPSARNCKAYYPDREPEIGS
jgi:hypothetical protein